MAKQGKSAPKKAGRTPMGGMKGVPPHKNMGQKVKSR